MKALSVLACCPAVLAAALVTACTIDDYARDDVGILARDGITLASVSFDQGVAVDVWSATGSIAPSQRPTILIADRPAYVRAVWDVPETWTPRTIVAALEITDAEGVVSSELRRRTIEGNGDLRTPEGAFDWLVPGEQMQAAASWRVALYEEGGAELDALGPPAARLPRGGGPVGVVAGKHEIDVRIVPIDHRFDGPMECEGPPVFDEARQVDLREYLARINPTASVHIDVRDEPMIWEQSAGNLGLILDALSALREADGAPPHVYYYGAIDPCDWGSTAGFAGLARVPNEVTRAYAWKRVAVGDMRRPGHASLETFVHEVGHNQGRRHIECKGNEGNPAPDYPFPMGDIGSYGFDHIRWALHPPSHADYMSYCDPTWVGTYGWNLVEPVIRTLTSWKYAAPGSADTSDTRRTLMIGVYDGVARTSWVRTGPPSSSTRRPALLEGPGGAVARAAIATQRDARGVVHLEIPLETLEWVPTYLRLLDMDDERVHPGMMRASRLQVPERFAGAAMREHR